MFERILITAGRARSRCTAVHPAALFAGNRWRPAGLPERDFAPLRRLSSIGPPASNSSTKMAVARACASASASDSKTQIVEGGCQADVAKLREIATQSGPFQFFGSETAGTNVCSHFAKRSQFHLTQIAAAGADLDTKSDHANYGHFFPAHCDSSVRSSRDSDV